MLMLKHLRTRGRAVLLLATFTLLAFAAASCTNEAEPVKIGILHSLTGTMAISETSLRDAVLMAVDEINAKGGVLGRKIEPVDRTRGRRPGIELGPVC
jgi:urea transport system substrate-binding protein